MARLRQTTRQVAQVFKVAPPKIDEPDWLPRFTSNINKQLSLISERFGRIPNIEGFDPSDYVQVADLRDELIKIDEEDEALVDTEGEAEGNIGGSQGTKRQRRSTRFRRQTWELIGSAGEGMEPTAAPPNVAAVSAIGTTTAANTGDLPRFALEDHTHGGVLGAPPAGGTAGQVAFFTSTFEINGDPGLTYDAPTNVLTLLNGRLDVTNDDNVARGVRLFEPSGSGSNYTEFLAQAQAANLSYTLPAAFPTVSGQALLGTTLGVLSWGTPAGTIIVQEDDVTVDAVAGTLDFTEPDATLVTSSPAGEANVAMNKYLLLAGRTGATNDPILSTDAAFATITATNVPNGTLRLRGSTSLQWVGSETEVMARLRVGQGIVGNIGTTELGFITVGEGTAYNIVDGGRMSTLDMMTALNLDGNIVAMRNVHMRSLITNTAGITSTLGNFFGYNNVPTFTPGAGSSMTGHVTAGVNHNITYSNTGAGNTITRSSGVRSLCGIGASWTATDLQLGFLIIPSGAGTITRFGGIELQDPSTFAGTIGAAYSVWAKGAYFLAHEGSAVFGAAQATLTAPTAGAIIDAFGNILINNTGTAGELRLAEPSGGGTSYTGFKAPALAGNIIYTLPTVDAAGGLVSDGAGSLSWDVDLGEIAALANVRGDLLVTNSTPAWARLAIGATDKYLRSDGSDPAWSDVTELGLVDTYNGIALVNRGVPHQVAADARTGLTGAVLATTIYAVPANGQGLYRISWVASITRAATTSSVLGGANGFRVTYTDPNDSVVKTSNPTTTTASTSAGNTTATTVSGTLVAYCAASTNLQYLFGYTSVGATTMEYDLTLTVEAL